MRHSHSLGRAAWATPLVLALTSLACNLPGVSQATATPRPLDFLTSTVQAAALTPAVTETPDTGQPTPTLPPGITPSPTVCTYSMSFVEDVTIPDGTEFAGGTAFAKTWRVRNNGCLPWPTGTQLVFFGGDQMGGSAVAVPATNIDSTQDVTVNLTAPATPGTYTGYWQLRAPDLGNFGPHVFVEIKVLASTPTATATQSVTSSPTPAYQVFLGIWNNQSADTTNITRMQIRAAEGAILVHMWNKGVPSDLDRGEISTPAADANDSVLYLSWVEDDFTETQQLSLLMDGRLQVNGQVNYVDASRTDFSYTEYFTRQP